MTAKGTFHLRGLYRPTCLPHPPILPQLISNLHSTFTQTFFLCVFTIFFQGHQSLRIKGLPFFSMMASTLIVSVRLYFQIMPPSEILGVRPMSFLETQFNPSHPAHGPCHRECPVPHQQLNGEAGPLYLLCFLYYPSTPQRPLLQEQSSCFVLFEDLRQSTHRP